MGRTALRGIAASAGALAALALVAGCSGAQDDVSEADCSSQVRFGDRVYTSHSYTNRTATRFGEVDAADCHDTGVNAPGSVFLDSPRQVVAWTFAGYSTDEVLGVRFDKNTFGVYVADTLSRDEADRIMNELRRPAADQR